MPYINVKITREPETTPELKSEVIRQITDVMANVLGKDPDTTFVVIEEVDVDNWGIAGMSTRKWRAQQNQCTKRE